MNEIIAAENNNAIVAGNDLAIPKGFICTIDTTDIKGKVSLVNAVNSAVSSKDVTGDVLRVVNVVTTPGARARTGEACTNTYLVCEDGITYFTQSDGVARDIALIVAAFTDKATHQFINPVELGFGVQIIETKLANGNTLKKCVLANL